MTNRQINPNQQLCNMEALQVIDISQYLFDHQQKKQVLKHAVDGDMNEDAHLSPHQSSKVSIEQSLFRQVISNRINMQFSNEELKLSHSEFDGDDSSERNRKDLSKNKIYAKNYRQKKKEKLKSLQEENRFLKNKIDDLSFRLKETQLELNKLKHNHQSNTQNFQTTRESILKQIKNIIEKQESTNIENLLEVEKKLKGLNAFDSKHKMDLLNYFMNELLENLINDFGFYFIDSLIEKKGFWISPNSPQSTRIDREISELLGQQDFIQLKQYVKALPQVALSHMKNFKTLWKKLYQDYVKIINQGLMIETLCRTIEEKNNQQNCKKSVLNYFKLELYFEKIKYRKDMRQSRESWFHEVAEEEQQARLNRTKCSNKKIKLYHQ